jgi:hypothetical protein
MKERLLFYLAMEVINYLILPYEVYLIGFSFAQSLVCRVFASVTDLAVVIFFFNTKKIWDAEKTDKTALDHLLAGVKLLIQFPVIYVLKVIFVNMIAIPRLQKWGFQIEIISWDNIGTTLIFAVIFCLFFGALYSIFRDRMLKALGLPNKKAKS